MTKLQKDIKEFLRRYNEEDISTNDVVAMFPVAIDLLSEALTELSN